MGAGRWERKILSSVFFFFFSRCSKLLSSPFLSPLFLSTPRPPKQKQEDKVAKAVHNYEAVVKEIDVRLSVAGGDAGKGPRAQRAEVTIFTHRYGVVRVEVIFFVFFSFFGNVLFQPSQPLLSFQ